MSQERLGTLTHHSAALIGRIEKAERRASLATAQILDETLVADGALVRLWHAAQAWRIEERARIRRERRTETAPVDPNVGLTWPATTAETIAAAIELWATDRRAPEALEAGAPSLGQLLDAMDRWPATPPGSDADVAGTGRRRIGETDAAALRKLNDAFQRLEEKHGGNFGLSATTQILAETLPPILTGEYTAATGRILLTEAARFTDLAGFMCFDSGRFGRAQRFYVQSLRMARAAGNSALGAHILTNMAMMATYGGDGPRAVSLSRMAVEVARGGGSRAELARCHAVLARSYAATGDARACQEAMAEAERVFDGVDLDRETPWIRFFTERQLEAERVYARFAIDQRPALREAAGAIGAPTDGMDRRHAYTTTLIATAFLPTDDGRDRGTDVETACAILTDLIPVLRGVTSARVLNAVNAARATLTRYNHLGVVRDFEERFAGVIGSSTAA